MRKHGAFALAILICFHSFEAVFASGSTANQSLPADVAKAAIERLGVGSRVTITLQYEHKVKGYISQIYADAFELTDLKGGGSTRIAYSDVSKAKRGTGWQTATKVLLGVGIALAIYVVAVLAYMSKGG